MDNNQPYNEFDQQSDDLPLPDQEASWQKMKELLDEEEKKRRVVPPVFLNCLGWGALMLILIAGAWYFLEPSQWWESGKTAASEEKIVEHKTRKQQETNSSQQNTNESQQKSTTEPSPNSLTRKDVHGKEPVAHKDNTPVSNAEATINQIPKQNNVNDRLVSSKKKVGKNAKTNSKKETANKETRITTGRPIEGEEVSDVNEVKEQIIKNHQPAISSERELKQDSTNKNRKWAEDTVAKLTDSAGKKIVFEHPLRYDSTASDLSKLPEEAQKSDTRKPKYLFSAGIGEQQQVPFNGQTAVPYNYYGRKGSLSDYIPSVYFKMEKENKWFVMGEFRYGAPQSLKEFSFSKQTRFDYSSNVLTTTTLRIKKTYYHQMPLTFNYYLKSKWSVGLGAMYSRFYGAVTEKETKQVNVQTQAETISKQITRVQNFTDSFLYKTQMHLILQTDYQWKRFTVGLRYSRDMQPFIKYTRPDGNIYEEKNSSLQFILRYRLWQSKSN